MRKYKSFDNKQVVPFMPSPMIIFSLTRGNFAESKANKIHHIFCTQSAFQITIRFEYQLNID